jgi:hypothetical protein
MWAQTLVPTAVGVRIAGTSVSGWPLVGTVVGEVVVCGLIVASVRRNARAWRAWTFLAIIVLLTGGLVARERIAQFGLSVANDIRYLVDFSWLLPLTLFAAFSPALARGGAPLTVPGPGAWRRLRSPRIAISVASVFLLSYIALSLLTATRLERGWPGSQARRWDQNIRSGLVKFGPLKVHAVVADDETPAEIVPVAFDPYSRLSYVLRLYSGSIQVDGPLVGPLLLLTKDGMMHRASATSVGGDGSLSALLRSRQARLSGIRRTDAGCYKTSIQGGSIMRTLQPRGTPTAAAPYLMIGYHVQRRTALPLYLDTGSGFPGEPDELVTLVPRASRSIAWLRYPTTSLHRFLLYIPPHTTLCRLALKIVTLTFADR